MGETERTAARGWGGVAGKRGRERADGSERVRGVEEQGLVSRRSPDEERRVVELPLTSRGQGFVDRRVPLFKAFEAAVPEGLTAAERDQLIVLLQKFLGLWEREA